MRFCSTDLRKLLLGTLIDLGFTAFESRILSGRMLGESNKDIASRLGIANGTVANEISKRRVELSALSHYCHDCAHTPVCEDYTVVPPIAATVCDNYNPVEEIE